MDTNNVIPPSLNDERHCPWVSQFVEAFFHILQSRSIAHCILRNYQDFPLPRSAVSDIDLMVDEDRRTEAVAALKHVVARQGLRVLLSYASTPGNLVMVYIAGPAGPALHVDLFTRVAWRQWDLVDAKLLLGSVVVDSRPPRPRPGHEAAVMLLGYLFHRGVVKPEYRSRVARLIEEDRAAFTDMVAATWSVEQAEALADLVMQKKWKEAVEWRERAAADLLRRSWGRGLPQTVYRSILLIRNVAKRLLHPPGLCIAVIGPDGCGKSTIGAALARSLASVFGRDKSHHLHWRPGILPPLKSILFRVRAASPDVTVPVTAAGPHDLPAHSGPVSMLCFLYFWTDFVIGANLLFRPWLWRKDLIVLDRYFYDFHVDQERYRLRVPRWLVSFCERFVPQPDLVFYLDAPEQVLLRRKNELGLPELSRQRAEFLALVERRGENAYVIDADRAAGEIAAELRQRVFDYLAVRERRTGALRGSGDTSYLMPLIFGSPVKSQVKRASIYAVLPSRRRPRWVLPAHSLRAMRKGMDFYAPPTIRGKASKWLIRAWMMTAIGPRLLNRVVFDGADESPVLHGIRSLIPGGDRALLATSFGAACPAQKLTLLIMDREGAPLAYAKVADSPAAVAALRADERMLRALEARGNLAGTVPQSLGLFESGQYLVHVQTAGAGRHSGRTLTQAHWRFLGSLVDTSSVSLHQYATNLCGIEKVADADLYGVNRSAAALLRRSHAKAMGERDEQVAACIVHGDFAPWNMRHFRTGRNLPELCVYDWEGGRECGLPLVDAFHFVVQASILADGADAARTLGRVRTLLDDGQTRNYLDVAGISTETAQRIFRLYLLEAIANAIGHSATADMRLQAGRIGILRELEAC